MTNSSESDQVSIDTAFKAHHDWKVSLQRAIERGELLDIETIKRDDCCALGKWLHADGKNRYGKFPAFLDLVVKHKNFHEVTSFVARIINGKDFETAIAMLPASNQFGITMRALAQMIENS